MTITLGIKTHSAASLQRQMLEFVDGWLRHKSDMVNYEAARVICEMKNVSPQQLSKAISGDYFDKCSRRL